MSTLWNWKTPGEVGFWTKIFERCKLYKLGFAGIVIAGLVFFLLFGSVILLIGKK